MMATLPLRISPKHHSAYCRQPVFAPPRPNISPAPDAVARSTTFAPPSPVSRQPRHISRDLRLVLWDVSSTVRERWLMPTMAMWVPDVERFHSTAARNVWQRTFPRKRLSRDSFNSL